MSSLHCPARVLVARHGEAEYETELCSDDGGSLTALGRSQARELADRLRDQRVARVWTSPLSRAVQSAVLGPVFRAWVDGDDLATIDGGERVGAIVARVEAVLEEVADAHPGETVLVVGHG